MNVAAPDFDPHAEACPNCEAAEGKCCEDWCAMCKQRPKHVPPTTGTSPGDAT